MNRHTFVETVLFANRVPGRSTLFVTGPYSGRVSFGSQQRRALNLVWAIDQDLRESGDRQGLNGKAVALVGAGIAGVTAALALSAHQADIWVYEKGENELEFIRDASHRNVHPSINFWPRETLVPTTELPFMNWVEAECNDVIGQIRTQWESLKQSSRGLRQIYTEHEVTGVSKKSERWELEFRKKGTTGKSKNGYDIVIFCTGFGIENDLKKHDSPSYWCADNDLVDEIKTESKTSPIGLGNMVVSGTGDGGLIEVLRLLFQSFEAGKVVAPEYLLHVDPTISEKILKSESYCQRMLRDAIVSSSVTNDQVLRDKISKILFDSYSAIFEEELPSGELLKYLRNDRTKLDNVVLLGRRPFPYEIDASPYHKFFLTFALREGFVKYLQTDGKLRSPLSKSTWPSSESANSRIATYRPKKVIVNVISELALKPSGLRHKKTSEDGKVFDGTFLLARHGVNSPLKKIKGVKTDSTLDSLRRCQQIYENLVGITAEQFDFYCSELGIPGRKPPGEWGGQWSKKAIEYFESKFGLTLNPVVDDTAPIGMRFEVSEKEGLESKNLSPHIFPRRIFCAEVSSEIPKRVQIANASGHP